MRKSCRTLGWVIAGGGAVLRSAEHDGARVKGTSGNGREYSEFIDVFGPNLFEIYGCLQWNREGARTWILWELLNGF